jgi:alpha-tubulin suppressor-like RCC1 family protein
VNVLSVSFLPLCRLTPTLSAIPENRRIVAVASGWRHSLALDAEGRVYSWGWGSYGQLGHGQRQ